MSSAKISRPPYILIGKTRQDIGILVTGFPDNLEPGQVSNEQRRETSKLRH